MQVTSGTELTTAKKFFSVALPIFLPFLPLISAGIFLNAKADDSAGVDGLAAAIFGFLHIIVSPVLFGLTFTIAKIFKARSAYKIAIIPTALLAILVSIFLSM